VSAPALPRNHDEYEALAVAWAIDALEPADQAVFEAHRDGCERCARAISTALTVATELAYGVPDVVPPPRLRERVLAAAAPRTAPTPRAETAPGAGPGADTAPRRREPRRTGPGRAATRSAGRMRRRRRLVYALAAAVLIAGSAVTTWEVTRPPPAADRIAALSAGGGTVATVVAHPKGAADVVTDSLPPNTGRGTAYYLWGVPSGDGGTPQVVGTFEVTAGGLHSYRVRLTRPLTGYPVLAISEEPAGSTPTSPSSVLGRGALGG
jgi:anti-sigma-K factor RskA